VHYTLIFTALLHLRSPNRLTTSSLLGFCNSPNERKKRGRLHFSPNSHYHWLSHTFAHAKSSLHTAKLLPRSHSANSLLLKHWLLRSHSGNWTKAAKSSAYKPSIVLAARAVLRHRVYSSVASEASLLACDVIAPAVRRSSARCGSIRHGTRETSYVVIASLAAWRADCCLATRNNIRNTIVACVYSVAGCVT
jgi:hypothetical protein